MLTTTEDFFIVVITVVCSLLFMAALNKLLPVALRRQNNYLIGWQLSILGTTYAVMLGFMLYTVWTNFVSADLNADAEANALVNIYRLAEGLPDEQRVKLMQAARSYADVVVERDWPAMARNSNTAFESQRITNEMWHILMT